MSVVIRESHATNDQPLFLSVNGGSSKGEIFAPGFDLTLTNGTPIGSRMTADGLGVNGTMYLQGAEVKFTQMGVGNANTTLSISPAGTNGDVLTVGGSILGIGPLPSSTTLDSTIKPVSIGTPADFTVSSPIFPLLNGAEYDVQCSGYWVITSATPALKDYAEIFLAVGSGTSPGYFNVSYSDYQFPNFSEDPWVSGTVRPFKIRARMLSNGIPAMTLQAGLYGTGTYSGISAAITTLDIVRVK